MKKKLKIDLKAIVWVLILTVSGACMLFFPSNSLSAAQNATLTCLNVLVPSLFPFMVVTVFLTQTGLARYVFFIPSKIVAKITGLNELYCNLFFIGMIGGYPSAAKNISICVKNKQIDVETAEILICFCTNAGPSFLVTAVGCKMFLSSDIGFILYVSSLLSSLAMLMVYSNKIRNPPKNTIKRKKNNYGDYLISSVKTSCDTMVMICALVVLFSVVLSYVGTISNKSSILKALLLGVFEVTSGSIAASFDVSLINVLLASAICAFGGLCVVLQIKSICDECNISLRKFITSRLLNVIFNLIFTFLLLFAIPIRTQQTFISNTISASVGILTTPVSSLMLLICFACFPFCIIKRKNL